MSSTVTIVKPVESFSAVEKKERSHRYNESNEEDFADVLSGSKKKKKKKKDVLLGIIPPASPSDGEALFRLMFQAENLHEPFEDASRIYASAEKKAGEKIDTVR